MELILNLDFNDFSHNGDTIKSLEEYIRAYMIVNELKELEIIVKTEELPCIIS